MQSNLDKSMTWDDRIFNVVTYDLEWEYTTEHELRLNLLELWHNWTIF